MFKIFKTVRGLEPEIHITEDVSRRDEVYSYLLITKDKIREFTFNLACAKVLEAEYNMAPHAALSAVAVAPIYIDEITFYGEGLEAVLDDEGTLIITRPVVFNDTRN